MAEKIVNETGRPGVVSSTRLMFRDGLTINKRMSRADFWFGVMGTTSITLALFVVFVGLEVVSATKLSVLNFICIAGITATLIIYLITLLTAIVRRLHDTNTSGWWVWIFFIPFGIGAIILIFMCCGDQKNENNKYGEIHEQTRF